MLEKSIILFLLFHKDKQQDIDIPIYPSVVSTLNQGSTPKVDDVVTATDASTSKVYYNDSIINSSGIPGSNSSPHSKQEVTQIIEFTYLNNSKSTNISHNLLCNIMINYNDYVSHDRFCLPCITHKSHLLL